MNNDVGQFPGLRVITMLTVMLKTGLTIPNTPSRPVPGSGISHCYCLLNHYSISYNEVPRSIQF